MKAIIRNTLVLTLITLGAGLLLGIVYEATKEPIEKQQELTRTEAYQEVFREADHFENVDGFSSEEVSRILAEAGFSVDIEEVLYACGSNDESLGYVLNVVSKEGYGGEIGFSMGIQNDGTINGISILAISETPGLGMNASQEWFTSQFTGQSTGSFSPETVDGISGATITTDAVTDGMEAGIYYFEYIGGGSNE